MYETNSSHIIAHVDAPNVAEIRDEILSEVMPGWEVDEMTGEDGGRYVSEADFPVYDSSADDGLPTDSDWAAWAEEIWSDR